MQALDVPLHRVRSGVPRFGAFLHASAEVAAFQQSLGPASPPDREWQHSPSNPRAYVAELRDVLVLPRSRVLLDAVGHARSDEMEFAWRAFGLGPKLADMEVRPGPRLRLRQPPAAAGVPPAGIHLTGEHESNYFHWVCEVLPRLHLYERLAREQELPLLVSAGLHANLYDLLDRVRSPRRTVHALDTACSHAVARLVYPSDVSRVLDTYDRAPGHDTVYLPTALLKDMAQKVRRSVAPALGAPPRRLFVRRNSGYRRLLNSDELEHHLAARGFHVVDPGALPVAQQVQLFSRAEVIVGPSGAAFANLLWCRPGARVLVLHPDHPFKKYPYWDALARAAGARIAYLPGRCARHAQGAMAVHDDFEVPLAALARALQPLLD